MVWRDSECDYAGESGGRGLLQRYSRNTLAIRKKYLKDADTKMPSTITDLGWEFIKEKKKTRKKENKNSYKKTRTKTRKQELVQESVHA